MYNVYICNTNNASDNNNKHGSNKNRGARGGTREGLGTAIFHTENCQTKNL